MTRRILVTAAALPVVVAGSLILGLVFMVWTRERNIAQAEEVWDD